MKEETYNLHPYTCTTVLYGYVSKEVKSLRHSMKEYRKMETDVQRIVFLTKKHIPYKSLTWNELTTLGKEFSFLRKGYHANFNAKNPIHNVLKLMGTYNVYFDINTAKYVYAYDKVPSAELLELELVEIVRHKLANMPCKGDIKRYEEDFAALQASIREPKVPQDQP